MTSSFDVTHPERITKLYSPRRDVQPTALVKPDLQRHPYVLLFFKAQCVPDQICLLVSGERNMRGKGGEDCQQRRKGQNWKKRNFVHVDDWVL